MWPRRSAAAPPSYTGCRCWNTRRKPRCEEIRRYGLMADSASGSGATAPAPLSLPAAGPRATHSLHARGLPLASPSLQIAAVEAVDLSTSPHGGDFARALAASGWETLRPGPID